MVLIEDKLSYPSIIVSGSDSISGENKNIELYRGRTPMHVLHPHHVIQLGHVVDDLYIYDASCVHEHKAQVCGVNMVPYSHFDSFT